MTLRKPAEDPDRLIARERVLAVLRSERAASGDALMQEEIDRVMRAEADAHRIATTTPKDAKDEARALLAKLDAAPLPPGASQQARLARANERAKLLTVMTGMRVEDLEANGATFLFPPRGSGDAA